MPSPSPAPIDLAWLDRVTFGDADLRRSVLQLFREEYAGYAARLQSASFEQRVAYAHRLRGAATGIGAAELDAISARIEAGEPFGNETASELEARLAEVLRSIDALLR